MDQLLELSANELRAWLLAAQPGGEQRANWWLGLVQPLETRVNNVALDSGVRSRWAALSVQVLEIARAVGALSDQEVANRLVYLSHAVAAAPGSTVPPALEPDIAARRSLANIRLSRAEALRMAKDWQDRPIDQIRTLRAVKNVLHPLVYLVDRITDDDVACEVRSWLEIKDNLP
ncbi:hypothetical protein [Saccharothrix variisporea]|uniref:hypothetical protein n=1 Tax=Saccharothrix variisporea TaxID=543527 RepID=UPI0011C38DBD|nr:hypothetical protein [Saccharothrix variisporea]